MEDFKTLPNKPYSGGIQYIAKFPNNYGASIIRHSFSYGNKLGLYELAVLKDGHICYDTTITDDVIGDLTEENVNNTLAKIALL